MVLQILEVACDMTSQDGKVAAVLSAAGSIPFVCAAGGFDG